MLSEDENPGLFYFMVGMIVLVFAGVGLSMLVDKRFKFSSDANSLQKQITSGESELASLDDRFSLLSQRMLTVGGTLKYNASAYATLRKNLTDLRQHESAAKATRAQLIAEVTALDTEFATYRSGYRSRTRAAAIGENIGTLTLRSGKVFNAAVIEKITDVGMEIRHADGIARIQAPDLDAKWQDRFQWNDEERDLRLKEEQANHESILRDLPPAQKIATKPEQIDSQPKDPMSVTELRNQLIGWRNKVVKLRSDKAEALSKAKYANRSSVTGGLETWKSKAARLNLELIRASGELSIAKSRLAAVAPEDELLRPEKWELAEY